MWSHVTVAGTDSQTTKPAPGRWSRLRRSWVSLILLAIGAGLAVWASVIYPTPETGIASPASSSLGIFATAPVGHVTYSVRQYPGDVAKLQVWVSSSPLPSAQVSAATATLDVALPPRFLFKVCPAVQCHNYTNGYSSTYSQSLVFGTGTFRYGDPRRHALVLISTIFGSGMSSRLFQRVREELGLAYSVYAFHSFMQASGVAGVYVGTQPPTAEQAADAIREEFRKLAEQSLTAEELASAKQQVKGQLVLALEGPVSRMYRIAGGALYGEPYKSLDALLGEVEAVTPEQVAAVAAEFYAPERQVVVWLGPS